MTRRPRPDGVTQLGSGMPSTSPLEASGATKPADVVSPPALLALSEAQFQRMVRAALQDRGFTCWVFPMMKLTTAGVPDILAWHARLPGLLLALELKREVDYRVTPKQRAALDHLETVPGIEARILRPSGWMRMLETLDLMLKLSSAPARWDDPDEERLS